MHTASTMDTERLNPAQIFTRLTGRPVQAYAVVCSVGENEAETVTAFIAPKHASPSFLHAIEMELAYSHNLLGFEEALPPVYNAASAIDLRSAAMAIGVDRVLCMVAMGADDAIFGTRDYSGLEVTVLEAASEQLTRFQDLLACTSAMPPVSRGLQ